MLFAIGELVTAGGFIAMGVFIQRAENGIDVMNPGWVLAPMLAGLIFLIIGGLLLIMGQRAAAAQQTRREKDWILALLEHVRFGMEGGNVSSYQTLSSAIYSAVQSDLVSLGVVRWALVEKNHPNPDITRACACVLMEVERRLDERRSSAARAKSVSRRYSVA